MLEDGRSKFRLVQVQSVDHLGMKSQRLVMDLLVRGGDEAFEERVRLVRFAQKFRVELAGNEKRVVLQLDDFHELAVG